MAYEVTATRKRPKGFDEMVGQDFVVATLKNALDTGKIAHAYLFSGPRGCGKTSSARILAKALNCQAYPKPTSNPCGECNSCKEIARGASLDVIEIDGASNTSVENVRQIRDEVLFAPNASRYKVYIIDEVHMLSTSAFNALLKTIEEPPPYVVFMFATTELHKVPATIKSRCQQFGFRLVEPEILVKLLSQAVAEVGAKAEPEALAWIAKASGGSIRDAYTLLDQVLSFSGGVITYSGIRETLGLVGFEAIDALARSLANGRAGEGLAAFDDLFGKGISVEQILIDLVDYYRALLFSLRGIESERILGFSPSRISPEVRAAYPPETVELILDILFELHRKSRFSLSPRFEAELALSRIAWAKDYVSPGDVLKAIEVLRGSSTGEGIALRSSAARANGSAENDGGTKRAETNQESRIFPKMPWERVPEAGTEHAKNSPSIGRVPSGMEKASSGPIVAGESDAPRETLDVTALREKMIEELKRGKLVLASTLERTGEWRLEGGALEISLTEAYQEGILGAELGELSRLVSGYTGTTMPVQLKFDKKDGKAAPQALPESVELVKKAFRGSVIQTGGSE